jgi:hypothetical protein
VDAAMIEAARVDPVAAAAYFVGTLGFTAFPVWGSKDGRCNCGDPHDGTRKHGPDNVGKHPSTAHGFKDATADLDRIRAFLGNPGTPNYGLNPPTGVLAIDVDGAEGVAHWTELERLYGELPTTFTTLTANGRHYFFRWPDEAGEMPTGKLFGYVIRRHDDGYVLGPGSIHPSGTVYDTLRQDSGMPYPIADLPIRWIQAALEQTKAATITVGTPLPSVGERHDWLRDRARYYRGFMDNKAALRAAILADNNGLPVPKTEAEVDRAIGEVFERYPLDPPDKAKSAVDRKLGDDELDLLGAPASGDFPAPPEPVAFDGLLGELVSDLADGTDASMVGLLGSTVAFCGALVPGWAYFHRQQTSSPFVALVGESSIGRKGTAMTRVMDAMSQALETATVHRVVLDGISSGEGLVTALHYRREHYPQEPTVGLVFEEEYATLMAARGRDGSTLDPRMRQAFDGGPLSHRRSGETKTVMPPYWLPALIGITPVELRHRLEPGALQSGSANRWLYLPVVRREVVPTNSTPAFTAENRQAIVDAHRAAQRIPPLLEVEPDVTRTLAEYSDFLPSKAFGVARDLTRRLGILAFRVALIHALMERAMRVTTAHLRRAIALTEYARRGIAWVFGDTIGNPDADLLFRHLVSAGRLRQSTISRQIIRDPLRRQGAIDELLRIGRAQVLTVHTAGRPRSELVPVSGAGAFVTYFHDSGISAGTTSETPELSAKSVSENWKKDGQKGAVRSDKRGEWASPCHFYSEHTSKHRLTPQGWVCDICSPESATA